MQTKTKLLASCSNVESMMPGACSLTLAEHSKPKALNVDLVGGRNNSDANVVTKSSMVLAYSIGVTSCILISARQSKAVSKAHDRWKVLPVQFKFV